MGGYRVWDEPMGSEGIKNAEDHTRQGGGASAGKDGE